MPCEEGAALSGDPMLCERRRGGGGLKGDSGEGESCGTGVESEGVERENDSEKECIVVGEARGEYMA